MLSVAGFMPLTRPQYIRQTVYRLGAYEKNSAIVPTTEIKPTPTIRALGEGDGYGDQCVTVGGIITIDPITDNDLANHSEQYLTISEIC
jgi:hypothetical protein